MDINGRASGRIVSIDRMRGFSLLGIFLVNMISFHSPYFYIDPETWWEGNINLFTYRFIDVLIQASFYPLFAMLFGYGLVILRERILDKGLKFTPLAVRRLSLLLLIGCIHAFFIWEGDILITYAVCGFAFLLFLGWSAKRLMIAGLAIYIVPNLLLVQMLGAASAVEGGAEFSMYDGQAAEQAISVYQTGSFAEVTEQRMTEWYKNNNLMGLFFYLITILPFFMFGAGAAKMRLFEQVHRNKKKIRSYAAALFILGLLIKSIPYLYGRTLMTDYAQDIFGGAMLAMAYALIIALLSEHRKMDRILYPLEAAGRLSISNYLFQSIFSTMIFYSYGLGYYGDVSIFAGTMLALAIYASQLAVSSWWVKRFYYGPVEWLWRSGTYLKKQRFKKGAA
ncbi:MULTISPECIES: DUF418 domain-containing protein [unclassified Mesobacillus]|uniref:DUF418 domain-containing protein n=1 Tax=unclassified Mesobacillus TaxID=2675270 RepID=UPI00203B7E49|nr:MULTISPECIES: DUF418 domain-containing protein [unclassified Mesobacillus]MCM3124918.1 DUF418 domain-containing protein [Mesobacillus sp. MER 33]MCM3232773.1 DUF418 domain-containing protein [Mesobacillus sp. MER 48]